MSAIGMFNCINQSNIFLKILKMIALSVPKDACTKYPN